jgi:hypothetical protein
MSPAQDKIEFPHWVPKAAQQRIIQLQANPLGKEEGRALLERLAKYDAMKTEVWAKLPSEPIDFEDRIVDWVFFAFTIFQSLRRPYPKTMPKMREWAKHIEMHPSLPEPHYQAGLANLLSVEISSLKDETDLYWSRFWGGDKSITPDRILEILDQLRLFYLQMDAEYRAGVAALPEVKRWSPKGRQRFFTEYLSKRMTETYGHPFDSIVAALADVAFDLPDGVVAETIRGRRRGRAPPEISVQKKL